MDLQSTDHQSEASSRSISTSLLNRIKASDAEAWQRLVELYRPLVFSWCHRSGLKNEDASDVVQEVFAKVVDNIGRFRREQPGDTFRGWLRVVTRNQIRLHFRNRADEPRAVGGSIAELRMQQVADGDANPLDSPDDELETSGLFHRGLEMIRSQFETRTWQAFWLVTVEGQTSVDAARQLGMTSGAVRQAKYEVLRRLRSELGDLLD